MALRVDVPRRTFVWARERSRLDVDDLIHRFPRLNEWERGEAAPTLKQLEQFAGATHTPIGYFFLPEPPDEPLPLPDFRTFGDERLRRPSSDLLDTIFNCQQRQEWYREYAIETGLDAPDLVGSLSIQTPADNAARTLRDWLPFPVGARGSSHDEAFRLLVARVEQHGILVMVNGVVGNNTHRKLDPTEFRGFTLIDDLAPVIFVNGADTKAAQIFTLVHELAHVSLGESALDDVDVRQIGDNANERWCSQVATQVLVPKLDFEREYRGDASTAELERLARRFKVSTLVIVRRIFEIGRIERVAYGRLFEAERDRILALMSERTRSGGGDFYNTQPARASRRFTRALIVSALEGRTLHRDAFNLLGVRKLATFNELAERVGAV